MSQPAFDWVNSLRLITLPFTGLQIETGSIQLVRLPRVMGSFHPFMCVLPRSLVHQFKPFGLNNHQDARNQQASAKQSQRRCLRPWVPQHTEMVQQKCRDRLPGHHRGEPGK